MFLFLNPTFNRIRRKTSKLVNFLTILILTFLLQFNFAHALLFGLLPDIGDIAEGLIIWVLKILLILPIIYLVLSSLMWLSAWLLEQSIEIFIQQGAKWYGLDVVQAGWELIRDVADSFFIFVLLYIGIATIIFGFNQYKKLLITVLVTAMLVNFSWFLTSVTIDISNVLADAFYTQIQSRTGGDSLGWAIIQATNTEDGQATLSLSDIDFEAQVTGDPSAKNLTEKIDDVKDDPTLDPSGIGSDSVWDGVTDFIKDFFITILSPVIRAPFNFILYAVLIHVFMYTAFIFLARYVTLVFLLILSPFAVASYAWPKAREYGWNPWSKMLIEQLLIAPILLLLLYITVMIMTSSEFKNDLHIILQYMVLIGLLYGSIIVSKKVSSGIVTRFAGWGAGVTSGLAASGAAGVGRKVSGVAGGGVQRLVDRGVLKNDGAAHKAAKRVMSSTYDLRDTDWGSKALSYGNVSLSDTGRRSKGYTGLKLDSFDSKRAEYKDYDELQEKLARKSIENNLRNKTGEKPSEFEIMEEAKKRAESSNNKGVYEDIAKAARSEATKKSRATAQETEYEKTEELSKVIREFSAQNASVLKDALQNAPTKVVVSAVSQNQNMLNNKDFRSAIDGRTADTLLKNQGFKNTSSQKHRDYLEKIRDKDVNMEPKTPIYGPDEKPLSSNS